MSRIRIFAAAALLIAVLAPTVVQAQIVFPKIMLSRLINTVTAYGAGPTDDIAVDSAIYQLEKTYWVLEYEVISTMCEQHDPPGPIGPYTFCSAEVQARVIRKAMVVIP